MTTRSTIMMIIICDKSLPTLIWTTLSELTTNPSLLKSLESSPACERGLPELAATISDSNTTCRKVLRLSKRLWKEKQEFDRFGKQVKNRQSFFVFSIAGQYICSLIVISFRWFDYHFRALVRSSSVNLTFAFQFVPSSVHFHVRMPVFSFFACLFIRVFVPLLTLSSTFVYPSICPSTHAFVLVGFFPFIPWFVSQFLVFFHLFAQLIFLHFSVHVFIFSLPQSVLPSITRFFIQVRSLIRSSARSFVRSFVHLFLRSCVPSFVHAFVCSCVCSFFRSFLCSFIRSFVRAFVS